MNPANSRREWVAFTAQDLAPTEVAFVLPVERVTLLLKYPALLGILARMLEPMNSVPAVPQVSLELHLRGNPPTLDTIKFSDSAKCCEKIVGLQRRCLPKAVATVFTLFRTYEGLTLFRIRGPEQKGNFVRTILNAKVEPEGKSQLRDLARGRFLQLFLSPAEANGCYFELDLRRLQPHSVQITVDGRSVEDGCTLRKLAEEIAATKHWDLSDYKLEVNFADGNGLHRVANAHDTRIEPLREKWALTDKDRHPSRGGFCADGQRWEALHEICCINAAPVARVEMSAGGVLDNPSLAAIREAIRHFCPNRGGQELRVGAIRSPAELEELWAIDDAAYGEASITYEKFKDWWSSFPCGLRALFFQNRIMGAIGIWPLSARCAGFLKSARLKESQLTGRMMHGFVDSPTRFWYASGIVLRPDLIGSRAIKILLSQAIGSLLKCAKIEFPGELLALAHSAQGQALLEGFNFYRIQNATAMPDHVHLYGLELASREHLVSLLKDRGLDVE